MYMLSCILYPYQIFSQSQVDDLVKFPPAKTPEVSTLQRYGEFNVNQYVGLPSIEIPLFVLKNYGLDIPITLSYLGGGCQVKEQSSWVGLNWNLFPGGCITESVGRNANQLFDAKSYNELTKYFYDDEQYLSERLLLYYTSPYRYGILCGDDYTTVGGSIGSFPGGESSSCSDIIGLSNGDMLLQQMTEGVYYQPNIYQLNILNYNCKFYIHPITKKAVTVKSDENIEIIDNRGNDQTKGWTVKLPNGIIVDLSAYETVTDGVAGTGVGHYSQHRCWKVSKITLLNGEAIYFNYSDHSYQFTTFGEDYTMYLKTEENINESIEYSLSINEGNKPSVMSYPKDSHFDSAIKSNYNVKHLTSITSSNYVVNFHLTPENQKPRLEYIDYFKTSDSQTKQRYALTYEPYKLSEKGWNTIDDKSYGDLEYYIKYKLVSLTESSIDNNKEFRMPSYRFEYTEDIGLPSVLSRAQDYWGYYNGIKNNTLLCDESRIFSFFDLDIPSNYRTIIRNQFTADRTIDEAYLKQGTIKKIEYPTGGYSIFNFEPHEFRSFQGYILNRKERTYGYYGEPYPQKNSIGAGLRIESIINYNSDGQFIEKNKYRYDAGTLLQPLAFMKYQQKSDDYYLFYKALCFSTQNIAASNLVDGTVGYTHVSVVKCGEENSDGTIHEGYTHYTFFCNEPNYTKTTENTYLFSNPEYRNGMFNTISIYDKDNKLIKKTYYNSDIIYSSIFTGIKARLFHTHSHLNIFNNNHAYYLTYYPIRSEIWKNTETGEYSFFDGDLEMNYEVNNEYYGDFYQIKSTKKANSQGDVIETQYRYANLINTPDYILMKEKNAISIPIEEITLKNGLVVSGKLNTFRVANGFYILDKVFKLETDKLINIHDFTYYNGSLKDKNYRIFVSYDSYDNKGNTLQYTDKDSLPVSYLWGYNGQYPIAEIKNATYDKIKSVLTESLINRLSTSPEPLATDLEKVNDLRSNVSLGNIMVTTYTYKPLVGMTSMTVPSGLTTYYDYDAFGRLKRIYIKEKDSNSKEIEKAIQSYDYHYRNQ